MSKRYVLALCAVLMVVAAGLAGCGGGHGDTAHEVAAAKGPEAERAFLEGMVPHHVSAVEMAELAPTRSRAPVIRRVSAAIVRSQRAEIAQMEAIHRRLFGSELAPDAEAHARLGLSAEEAGMAHMDGAATLGDAEPFDRAFADEMIAHHRGAVAMAEAVLAETEDAELSALARTIITEQRREIRELTEFRTEAFGVPPAAESGGHP